MSEKIKGYVVRGRKRGGEAGIASGVCGAADDACAEAVTFREDGHTDVRILAVHADGSETPLPTYDEALVEIERLREEVAGWKDQASANAHGCEQRKAFQEAAEQERDEARAEVARLRACPLAALVRTFRSDPANPDARGPVWTAFNRVVAAVPEDGCDEALVKAIEDLECALSVRLMQMREALDERDVLLAEGPAS